MNEEGFAFAKSSSNFKTIGYLPIEFC